LNELVTVGRVGRPHGVDGSFFVDGASDAPERFAKGATLLVDGEPAEIVASKRGAGGRVVIGLDRPVARGATLAVRRDELPELGEDAYYVFELVGLVVEEEGGRPLGTVVEVENRPANDVLVLDSGLLLPLVDACVLDVSLELRRIVVAPSFADGDE
jgi:16S rRNA processing protein RimM